MQREKYNIWTVMFQKFDGKISICNYISMDDAIRKVDELKNAAIKALQRETDTAIVLGNHKEFVIMGYKREQQLKTIIKIGSTNLCFPENE